MSVPEFNSVDQDTEWTIQMTSVAVFFGCIFFYVWRNSTSSSSSLEKSSDKGIDSSKPSIVKNVVAEEMNDGKKKVVIFFGTQTGTAEEFAKVITFRC